MNSKDKFLKAIEDNIDVCNVINNTGKVEAANQCTKISIEEKIKLLDEMFQANDYQVYLKLKIELQAELKQLSK